MANKAGRPRFEPTDEQRRIVKGMAALGIPFVDIGYVLGVSEDTIKRRFRSELDVGPAEANARVGNFLYQQAQKNLTAAIFWAKTRMGWRETNRTEITGADGEALQRGVILDKPLTQEQWDKLYGRAANTVGSSGGSSESSD
jgi:hypothetical protein